MSVRFTLSVFDLLMAHHCPGTDKEKYKQHMKKKALRESWENALSLYRQKELEGDRIGTCLLFLLLICPF